MILSSLTTGRLSGEDLVELGGMASMLLRKELLSYLEIWPDLFFTQIDNVELRQGSRVAV